MKDFRKLRSCKRMYRRTPGAGTGARQARSKQLSSFLYRGILHGYQEDRGRARHRGGRLCSRDRARRISHRTRRRKTSSGGAPASPGTATGGGMPRVVCSHSSRPACERSSNRLVGTAVPSSGRHCRTARCITCIVKPPLSNRRDIGAPRASRPPSDSYALQKAFPPSSVTEKPRVGSSVGAPWV